VYTDTNIHEGAIAGTSKQALTYIKELQSKNFTTDILLLNTGSHDIKRDKTTHQIRVTSEEYEKNLNKILTIAKVIATTTIRITTTLHDEKRHNELNPNNDRLEKENEQYHQIALEVTEKNNIPTIDLREFTKHIPGETLVDHIHFTEEVRERQAQFILEELLKKNYHL